LALYPQIAVIIEEILSAAQAGGMTEEAAETIYNAILSQYCKLDGGMFWPFREVLMKALHTPDQIYEALDDDGISSSDRLN